MLREMVVKQKGLVHLGEGYWMSFKFLAAACYCNFQLPQLTSYSVTSATVPSHCCAKQSRTFKPFLLEPVVSSSLVVAARRRNDTCSYSERGGYCGITHEPCVNSWPLLQERFHIVFNLFLMKGLTINWSMAWKSKPYRKRLKVVNILKHLRSNSQVTSSSGISSICRSFWEVRSVISGDPKPLSLW